MTEADESIRSVHRERIRRWIHAEVCPHLPDDGIDCDDIVNLEKPVLDYLAWILSLDDDDPDSEGRKDRQHVTLTEIVERARQALQDVSGVGRVGE